MALTKEDLLKIKLPLSDEDYMMLHDELETSPLLLESVSQELDDAYDRKMWEIFDQVFPGNNAGVDEVMWFPPQTEKYKDHPENVRLRENRERLAQALSQRPQLMEKLGITVPNLQQQEEQELDPYDPDNMEISTPEEDRQVAELFHRVLRERFREEGIPQEPPTWLEWPKDQAWPPAWLTEDSQQEQGL